MTPLRTLFLPAMAVAGAAAWAWSQEAAPPFKSDLEIRAVTESVPANFPVFTAPAGAPALMNGSTGVVYGSSDGMNWSVGAAGPAASAYRAVTRPRTVMETYYITLQPEEVAEQKELQGLIEVLHSDKTAGEKEKAKGSLGALLQKQFTRDVERREKEVAELEERVKKLRSQLEKRKEAKEKIISLRLTTIQNEAEGLGFPEEGRGGGNGPYVFEKPVAPGASPYGGGGVPQPVPVPPQNR